MHNSVFRQEKYDYHKDVAIRLCRILLSYSLRSYASSLRLRLRAIQQYAFSITIYALKIMPKSKSHLIFKTFSKKISVHPDLQPPKRCQQAASTKSPIHRAYAALTGLKGLKSAFSSLLVCMALQGGRGSGSLMILHRLTPGLVGLTTESYKTTSCRLTCATRI